MSERTDFLITYTERLLGRSLTDDEKGQFDGLRSRNEARSLAKTFVVPKRKAKKAKPKDESMEKTIDAVVNSDEV